MAGVMLSVVKELLVALDGVVVVEPFDVVAVSEREPAVVVGVSSVGEGSASAVSRGLVSLVSIEHDAIPGVMDMTVVAVWKFVGIGLFGIVGVIGVMGVIIGSDSLTIGCRCRNFFKADAFRRYSTPFRLILTWLPLICTTRKGTGSKSVCIFVGLTFLSKTKSSTRNLSVLSTWFLFSLLTCFAFLSFCSACVKQCSSFVVFDLNMFPIDDVDVFDLKRRFHDNFAEIQLTRVPNRNYPCLQNVKFCRCSSSSVRKFHWPWPVWSYTMVFEV